MDKYSKNNNEPSAAAQLVSWVEAIHDFKDCTDWGDNNVL